VPRRALEVAVAGLRLSPVHEDPVLRFALRIARGGALFDLGDRPGGLLELQEAQADLGGTYVPPTLAASAALLEHRAALLLGYPAAATTSMGRLPDRGTTSAERTLMRAWSEAATGAADHARATIRPLLDGSQPATLGSTLVEAWLVEVWGALRAGDRPAARKALRAALGRAEPLDVLRPFALAGQGQRVLLVDQLGGARDPDVFAFRCLAARRQAPKSHAPPLSAREQDVLAELVSLSNLGEIAEDLDVSVNTVKSHVRAIYGKLGVNTRRNAVLTALESGILA
jgi:LuxR family maltose regulon positive regulatory protein